MTGLSFTSRVLGIIIPASSCETFLVEWFSWMGYETRTG